MKHQKKIIIANWKMNPSSLKKAERLFEEIARNAGGHKNKEIVVCPPLIYAADLKNKLGSGVWLGAQNCFWENEGAYTGEISPVMLKNSGITHVILGHSERRNLGETDEIISKKISAALKVGLKTVFCVGEKERDREDRYFDFIKEQMEKGLALAQKKYLKNLLMAYEPVWAISSNKGATPDDPEKLFKMAIFIKKVLAGMFGREIVFNIPILYGGSVSQKNAGDFTKIEGISGLLVGGASLNVKEFTCIISNV